MIDKLLKFVNYPVGDTVVLTKDEAIDILRYQQQLEVNSMLSEVLVDAITNKYSEDIKAYLSELMESPEFVVSEYINLKKAMDDTK